MKCKDCKFWTGELFGYKSKWRKCENPKSVGHRMYRDGKYAKCKDGVEVKDGEAE